MWNFENFVTLIFVSTVLVAAFNFVVVDTVSKVSKPSSIQNSNKESSLLQRGADVQEFIVDEATEKIMRSVLPEIKKAVAERISSYTVFIHEDHVFNLLWAVPKLKFTAVSYKSEVTNGIGMMYYVKYKVGRQCFQVKVFKSFDGDVTKVEDAIGAISCNFPVLFF